MSFNELNTVEYQVVHRMSGLDLNTGVQATEPGQGYGIEWCYKSPEDLGRSDESKVLLLDELRSKIDQLNPLLESDRHKIDQVIYELNSILINVHHQGLVRSNEKFLQWLTGEKTMPLGENGKHISIHLIDFENPANNSYTITNQFRVLSAQRETKIPDVVLFINGIPVVVGEAKTPVNSRVSWMDGAQEVHKVYENTVRQLFVPNILSFATEGKELFYGAVGTPIMHWAPWRVDSDDAVAQALGLAEVGNRLQDLLQPSRLLDILKNFTLFSNNKGKRIKIIPRFQQYEGANLIVERVKEGSIKKGLIWHFQGSGKSLLMVFAAQKLRRTPELEAPTVIVLVDRTDLDTQISGTFNAADVANTVTTESIRDLHTMLSNGTQKIIISMIHKFKDAPADMNTRENIIVLVDEAHRTQEGDLGRTMRAALPNAFLFGLTGTPVNKADKNTFWAFGAEEDTEGYLSKYTFHDSIRDEATLPLHFEPRLVDVHVDKETIDQAMEDFVEAQGLSDEEADALNKKSARMSAFLKSPERVNKIVADIATHYKEKVAPHGFKAMIVTPDRYACVQYKEQLDQYFPENASRIVMSTTANDDVDFKKKWGMDKGEQEKVVETFNDAKSELKFLIVTAKLLTGFDAPILQTMYLDKSLKDHTLLQAICRTNRLYKNKYFGRIVDYFGLFDDTAKALEFDEKTVKTIITNLSQLREELPDAVDAALSHFPGVDRTIEGFEGLEAAQEAIKEEDKRDKFAADFKYLAKLWESLSPDNVLNLYQADFKWLAQVYESVRPAPDTTGTLLWYSLGDQVEKLMQENIHVGEIHDMKEYVLDADVIEEIFNNPSGAKAKQLEKILIKRFKKHAGNPKFIALSERLEALRDKAERGLIDSIEFIQELCKIAKETVEAEKAEEEAAIKTPKAALTELFMELKTDQTPAVVERIVSDIDQHVRLVSFPGWQNTSKGEREVKKSLRKTLWIKYKLKDEELFNRAYAYIEQYY